MTVMKTVNPRLDWFVKQMREKLALPHNQDKGDWREADLSDIFDYLESEVKELRGALMNGTKERVIEEAADVANFAFMVADMIGPNGAR